VWQSAAFLAKNEITKRDHETRSRNANHGVQTVIARVRGAARAAASVRPLSIGVARITLELM
jgi:hypothetical protein